MYYPAILRGLTIHKLIVLQAISWAHGTWKADIVAMAFKLGKYYPAVSKAIDTCNKSVVFFAAAGNDGANVMEGFPACHKGVIPVRATNTHGQFLDLNPCS
jgi:subtilisin family serine protease